MSVQAETAFSVLAGLDPLRGGPAREQMAVRAEEIEEIDDAAQACLARIIATPRPGVAAAPARRVPLRSGAAEGRRTRYGAIGLLASAAVAVITTMLWASPSAGSPPDQAVNAPTAVGQVHSPPQT
jgi:hypothetical protein